MTDDRYLTVHDLSIPLAEFDFKASRSGGPGGQHVNRSATQVELWWDIGRSPTLTDEERARLLSRLAPRLDTRDRLRLVSNTFRSQRRNRDDLLQRLQTVLAEALREEKPRKPTRPPAGSREDRLRDKKRRGDLKRLRRRPPED